jgi:cell wall-associated NlpC family hydrolase
LIAGSTLVAQADETKVAHAQPTVVAVNPVADVQSPDVATWTSSVATLSAAPTEKAEAKSHGMSRLASRILGRTSTMARGIAQSALRFIGVPYVFGGTSTGGFDCSGYTQHVFAMMGLHIPRTADAQYYAGSRVTKSNMVPGDLVFFQTYEPGPSHVGIYLGNGRFVHASSSHGVMVSSLSDSYWSVRYLGAKRLASR